MRTHLMGLAFALLVPGGLASAQVKCVKTVLECIEDGWTNVVDWDGLNPTDSLYWSDKIAEVEWDLDSNAGCADVKAEAESAFSSITWYVGTPKGGYTGWHVEGSGEPDGIVLDGWYMVEEPYDDDIKLDLILHEVGHAAGYQHPEGEGNDWWPIYCGQMPENNEEEDDDDGGGGDPEPTTTCTDSEEWVPPVTMRVWVKPESTMGESGPPVDLDHEVGYRHPEIVINVESGYWEEVVVSDGYYRTVTTCTTG